MPQPAADRVLGQRLRGVAGQKRHMVAARVGRSNVHPPITVEVTQRHGHRIAADRINRRGIPGAIPATRKHHHATTVIAGRHQVRRAVLVQVADQQVVQPRCACRVIATRPERDGPRRRTRIEKQGDVTAAAVMARRQIRASVAVQVRRHDRPRRVQRPQIRLGAKASIAVAWQHADRMAVVIGYRQIQHAVTVQIRSRDRRWRRCRWRIRCAQTPTRPPLRGG
jgi:hypothetical protein